MIGGKRFKTLREAKKHEQSLGSYAVGIYKLHNRVYKYFVGTHLEWLNL